MINLFSKGASFLLQVIFVVAAVLVFTWFDPFDFLAPTKTTLKDTPIQVESIKEIGKLITAEYYGEVIASLDEVIEKELQVVTINFKDTIDYINDHFKDAIQELQKVEKFEKKQNPYQYFYLENINLISTELFEVYLKFVFDELSPYHTYKFNDFDDALTGSQKEKLFRKLYKNKWKITNITDTKLRVLTAIFDKIETKKSYKEYKKSKLVLIGRGWIKAGFNFENFNDRNFRYNKDNKKVYFIGLKPEILSKTMNPWFIPEEGVEGFEFIIAEKGGLHNPEYTKKVKRRCLEKLEAQALEKQILKKAKKNAENGLKTFFEILLNEELKAVAFHSNYLNYMQDALISDTIKNNDLFAIDSSLVFYYKTYMPLSSKSDSVKFKKDTIKYVKEITNLTDFMDSLTTRNIEIFEKPYPIDSRTSLFFEIIEDFKIDTFDYQKIKDISQLTLLDTIWYMKPYLKINTDTLQGLIKGDSIQFFRNLENFIQNRDPEHDFNDPVMQQIRDLKKDELAAKLKEIFEGN